MYRTNVVITSDIVPLLTLVSSILNLTINIVSRLYQAINRLYHGSFEYENTKQDPDDSEDLQPLRTQDYSDKKSIQDKFIMQYQDIAWIDNYR